MIRRPLAVALCIVVGSLCVVSAGHAQEASTAELKKDIDALKATLAGMQKDLQEIKALLQPRAPQAAPSLDNVMIDVANRPSRGSATAKVLLIEFSDYQCPFCERHTRDTHPQIAKEFIDTGKVRQVFMDLPLESIHKSAFKAAEAARCAGEQGKYWEMHDRLFNNQRTLTNWDEHAAAVTLNAEQFSRCLASGKYAADIRKDLAQAQAAGINGTPGFLLAFTTPAGSTVKPSRALVGAQPFAAFKTQIDAMLNEADAKKP